MFAVVENTKWKSEQDLTNAISNGQEAPGKDPDHKQIAINKFTIKEKAHHTDICISAVWLKWQKHKQALIY